VGRWLWMGGICTSRGGWRRRGGCIAGLGGPT